MEVKILTTLKWRLCSITPFNFIHYLLFRLKGTNAVPQDLISQTIAFIMNTTRVIDFSDHRPSSIAAAAIMCACKEVLQTESADCKEAILSSKQFNKEKIISCYNLMQQLVMDNFSTTNKISSGTSHTQNTVHGSGPTVVKNEIPQINFAKILVFIMIFPNDL
ncbi:cyclin-D1-2-like isoform X1 [Cryptomeria japonica]|uniref:cyclin-D1-2-like isoform X1 n=1 Tax=Cryptomeria japonica TaxID=3369 RepID=UPI0027DA69FE|nr:cyclin-D1-2-like isoform X1 [Cryptomeria japonica]XP_059066779.1 cyclin-D1-2-like isoform X1 [Cryptomeria japonica]